VVDHLPLFPKTTPTPITLEKSTWMGKTFDLLNRFWEQARQHLFKGKATDKACEKAGRIMLKAGIVLRVRVQN
jgi:hypothetical protein